MSAFFDVLQIADGVDKFGDAKSENVRLSFHFRDTFGPLGPAQFRELFERKPDALESLNYSCLVDVLCRVLSATGRISLRRESACALPMP